ncbi:hypothetical protein [Aeromicrobium sp. 179-A 4D2 NHS]|uniref:hypothetical protein n=1 Tax=Aeromicrobium sp. 179-A 4D2 NHS TaxID=3142375 RepID=UPI0039A17A77
MASAMFSLTDLTGRNRDANRTTVIGTVEMKWRVWIILLIAFPFAILAALFAMPFVGITGLLLIPVVEGGAVFLIHRRTKSGLKLRTYEHLLDKQKAVINQYFLGGQPIDMNPAQYSVVYTSSAPNPNIALDHEDRQPFSLATAPREPRKISDDSFDDDARSSHQKSVTDQQQTRDSRAELEALFS